MLSGHVTQSLFYFVFLWNKSYHVRQMEKDTARDGRLQEWEPVCKSSKLID